MEGRPHQEMQNQMTWLWVNFLRPMCIIVICAAWLLGETYLLVDLFHASEAVALSVMIFTLPLGMYLAITLTGGFDPDDGSES